MGKVTSAPSKGRQREFRRESRSTGEGNSIRAAEMGVGTLGTWEARARAEGRAAAVADGYGGTV